MDRLLTRYGLLAATFAPQLTIVRQALLIAGYANLHAATQTATQLALR